MILDLLAGFIIICLLIVYFALVSLAITYWFIFLPLFIIWFVWMYKREQKRQIHMKYHMDPQTRARLDRDLAVHKATNDMFKRAREREKAQFR